MHSKLQPLLLRSLAEILSQGKDLHGEIDDRQYAGTENGGAVGEHFRHCLEFVNCFLAGASIGQINYEKRKRNHRLETERKFAIAEYERTIKDLEHFAPNADKGILLVKPESFIDEADLWCESSVERELEFLQSHTIHHYALIAFKLRAMNFAVSDEFGVAPSTLRFWKAEKLAKQ